MPPRLRKLIGALILLPGLAVYLIAAAALGERIPNNWLLQVPYYLAAGLLWAFPVILLMRWMNGGRPSGDRRGPSQNGS